MRSVEDKQEISNGCSSNVRNQRGSRRRTALGKPTPSKWDDAQKWLSGLSRGTERSQSKATPRNSNADDRRLIAPVPQKEKDYSSDEENGCSGSSKTIQFDIEKKVDCEESFWRINKASEDSTMAVRSICVRDMGTEMTPIASQEPSRTATPIRATTPAMRSPISSGSSTPARFNPQGVQSNTAGVAVSPPESRRSGVVSTGRGGCVTRRSSRDGEEGNNNKSFEETRKVNPLETRAMAWDEAERAKYMARYKREEVKIQAWENHEKRKAEMEMRRMEVKAERLKSRAQERLSNKVAAARRIAEEKRANAEAKLNEKAVQTSEKADYIRRTGHLPSFTFKLPSLCW